MNYPASGVQAARRWPALFAATRLSVSVGVSEAPETASSADLGPSRWHVAAQGPSRLAC